MADFELSPVSQIDPTARMVTTFQGLFSEGNVDSRQIMIFNTAFQMKRRVLFQQVNSGMWLESYRPEDRRRAGELLSKMLGSEVMDPWGQVEFNHIAGSSEVLGHIYVTDTVAVSSLEMRFNDHDLVTQAAQDCFAAADDLGIGGQWTNGLLSYLRGEARSPIVSVEQLSDPAVAHLNQALVRAVQD